ncbi:sarcoplasmic reticulum histidine-rich calcium-binding protein-like [Mytilus californianus]|uniref:sarcoplasmic reticulum histidine-rich calcium-binding protein-like n=1 Tax=Mytilus californianus TaxID=6549 RepID=UPI002246AD58|nr:sarcoplasmic reticulum histidine-rich calcium-binding protein-like [Mytilus californianus]
MAQNFFISLLFCLALIAFCIAGSPKEDVKVDDEKVEYAKGSVCGYCSYCKFCKLCEKDCPCETSASKPNCKMCKYCKYCNLCSAVCDTICQPGGILDKVSAAIVSALPSHDPDEINKDIDSVKEYIDRKDEL